MSHYYDDNYGHYDTTGEDAAEMREFYNNVQRNSVWKNCKCCDRKVFLRRDYAICNSCAEAQERGYCY
jgi:hypothetical protein